MGAGEEGKKRVKTGPGGPNDREWVTQVSTCRPRPQESPHSPPGKRPLNTVPGDHGWTPGVSAGGPEQPLVEAP